MSDAQKASAVHIATEVLYDTDEVFIYDGVLYANGQPFEGRWAELGIMKDLIISAMTRPGLNREDFRRLLLRRRDGQWAVKQFSKFERALPRIRARWPSTFAAYSEALA